MDVLLFCFSSLLGVGGISLLPNSRGGWGTKRTDQSMVGFRKHVRIMGFFSSDVVHSVRGENEMVTNKGR